MLVRRRSETPFLQLREEMDRLFHDFFEERPGLPGLLPWRDHPPVNVWQDENSLFVEMELPGVASEAVEVRVEGNECIIKGERREPVERKGVSWVHRERESGPFSRIIRVPVDVDPDRVEADLKAGVLLVKLPKSEVARTRRIEVRAVEA